MDKCILADVGALTQAHPCIHLCAALLKLTTHSCPLSSALPALSLSLSLSFSFSLSSPHALVLLSSRRISSLKTGCSQQSSSLRVGGGRRDKSLWLHTTMLTQTWRHWVVLGWSFSHWRSYMAPLLIRQDLTGLNYSSSTLWSRSQWTSVNLPTGLGQKELE